MLIKVSCSVYAKVIVRKVKKVVVCMNVDTEHYENSSRLGASFFSIIA